VPLFQPVDGVCCAASALLDAAMARVSRFVKAAISGQFLVFEKSFDVIVERALIALESVRKVDY